MFHLEVTFVEPLVLCETTIVTRIASPHPNQTRFRDVRLSSHWWGGEPKHLLHQIKFGGIEEAVSPVHDVRLERHNGSASKLGHFVDFSALICLYAERWLCDSGRDKPVMGDRVTC